MSDVILCNLSDANKTIEEFRKNWILEILLNLGIPQDLFGQRYITDFRFELSETYGVEVELKANGEINVYKKQWNNDPNEQMQGWLQVKEKNLVAQWKIPTKIRRIENNHVFYEIHLNEWSFAG
jgi:hypothetical protein